MAKNALLNLVLFTLVLSSCKTTEQIRREQLVDSMSTQLKSMQTTNAQVTSKMRRIEEKLSRVNGIAEEREHQTQLNSSVKISTLEDRLGLMERKNTLIEKDLRSMKAQLASQKKYLDRVLKTLSAFTKRKK